VATFVAGDPLTVELLAAGLSGAAGLGLSAR
jgi:hypothetical protein